jgi:phenylpyruvate tautomerase PptA (4-oxalocrotonate tautomerase family)
MPHLQFEVSGPLDGGAVEPFAEWTTELYADVMETGTGHVCVTVRDGARLSLGRAGTGEPVAVLNADIRAGRSADQRRALAEAVIKTLGERWGVPAENVYVVYTEHPGEDFHLDEGRLDSWSDSEREEGALGRE